MHLSLIAALTPERVIGKDNHLPWRLPADMQYFKKTTWGKPIIMGRKTYESLKRALPGRRNIVITRNPAFQATDCEVVTSLDAALLLVKDVEEVMVIGGGEIYKEAFPYADRLYLTLVYHTVAGDTFFPEWEPRQWREISCEEHAPDADNPYSFTFLILERTEKR